VAYFDLTGQELGEIRMEEGRRWVVGDIDLLASIRSFRAGATSLRSYLRSLRGVRETGYFAMDDPLPLLVRLADDAKKILGRVLRKVTKPFRPKTSKTAPIPFTREQKQPA
jgi:predicted ATP-grasp superfamily ATP-dependent carboligase